jgi:hypothetical protein
MVLLNKKGQLQIQETILVVFIFIILIMFGLVFFYRVQLASIAEDFNEFQNTRDTINFITIGDLPEFSCSKLGIRESCIDTLKLNSFIALNNSAKYRSYYFERFGYKKITITQIYPEKNEKLCSNSQIEDCGLWNIYENKPLRQTGTKIVRDTPVSLYFPDKDEYGIGILVVESYE